MHNKYMIRWVSFSYLANFPDGLAEEALHDPRLHPHHAVRGPADSAIAAVLVDGRPDLKFDLISKVTQFIGMWYSVCQML